jgi:hypothetical protein
MGLSAGYDRRVSGPSAVDAASPPNRVAAEFNEAINRRDLGALADLMTEDHTFVDSDGNVFAGSTAADPGRYIKLALHINLS